MKKNIITFANIIAFASTTLLLTSCDTGGEDDGTVGNQISKAVLDRCGVAYRQISLPESVLA